MASNRVAGDRQEQRIARRLGGTVVPGSGSTRERKQDIRFARILMQVKSTARASISIKLKDLLDTEQDALNAGRIPALALTFTSPALEYERDFIAFPLWWIQCQEWFLELTRDEDDH